MQELSKAIKAAWHAAWDQGDVDAFDEILHADYRRESTGSNRIFDRAALKQEIRDVRGAFPDLTTTVDSLIIDESESEAAIFWHTSGTFRGELAGVPATGSRVETRGSNLLTIRDGRIVSEDVTWDRSELLKDLGVPSLRSAFDVDESIVEDYSASPNIEAIKGFNRQFVTGVTVVTTTGSDGEPRGLAANSYASVSLEPPLVLVCVQKTSSTYPALFTSTHLGINILSNSQRGTVGVFASKTPDKFAELEWHAGPNGSPLIDGSAASIEAEIKERFQAKTHTIFIAKVRHAEFTDTHTLVYKAGRFYDGERLEEIASTA